MPNRLAGETSPYLLQHAHNPVDWYPWGDEAFAAARERGAPIFLSVGYATCYWCHVMERESFEHAPTAALMNERFVCVKVDREERPDLDELYIAATSVMTGHAGWPMSCFLDPDSLEPFWCGTYYPRDTRPGMPTFTQVLEGMSNAWRGQREEVLEQARRVAAAVREHLASPTEAELGPAHAERAVAALLGAFDRTHGGFGGAPKFPQPVFLEFLLDAREGADDGTRAAIDAAVRTTLDAMLAGGVHDQAGGGFHRYAVDAEWTVPHFEKMLYDNAQLLALYARAAGVYSDAKYRRVARRTAVYMLRELARGGPPGAAGFISAQDAEVDGREGLNYLWTPDEASTAVGPGHAELAARVYGLDRAPNFRDPHHPGEPARFVLRLDARPDQLAASAGVPTEAFEAGLDEINDRLLRARSERPQPREDDKILTAWNGLAIGALALAGTALGDPALLDAAERAAGFLLEHARRDGDLARSVRAGRVGPPAVLEDYACLAGGLLALERAHPGAGHEQRAKALIGRAAELFGDGAGGFFDTREGQGDLFVRARSTHDGAIPSGVSMMLACLLDLAERDDAFLAPAAACLGSVSGAIDASETGAINSTRQLLRLMRLGERASRHYDFTRAGPAAPAGSARAVEVLADAERVVVREGEPAVLNLALRVAPGHHVVAADPGGAGGPLVPLRVGLVRGQGVAVYADYPAGEPHGVGGVGAINVHTGVVEFRVAIEKADGIGASPGTPVLGVTFQACSGDACYEPTTVALAVEVEIE